MYFKSPIGSSDPSLYEEMLQNSQSLSNAVLVLQQVEACGLLQPLQSVFQSIFKRESKHFLDEFKHINPKIDCFQFLNDNLTVFKENLKIVTNLVSLIKSRTVSAASNEQKHI